MREDGILVAGTLAHDTVARVDALPAPDEAALVTDRVEHHGGAGANVAAALARLGVGVPLVAAVGSDFPGSGYEDALLAMGVDLAHVGVAGDRTAHAWLFTGPDGRQQIYFDAGASRRMDAVGFPEDAGERWGHFAPGPLASYPPRMEEVARASLDMGQELFHSPDAALACVERADVLFVNRHERERLEELLGHPVGELLDAGLEVLVETRGRDGARVRTVGGTWEVPAVGRDAVDPTGAGDAHRAGFLLGVHEGLGWEACARLGAVVASFAVEAMGTQTNLPTRAEARARFEDAFGPAPF